MSEQICVPISDDDVPMRKHLSVAGIVNWVCDPARVPAVKWFRNGTALDRRKPGVIVRDDQIVGCYIEKPKHELWLSKDLDGEQLVEFSAHESFHACVRQGGQSLMHFCLDGAKDFHTEEAQAERFGQRIRQKVSLGGLAFIAPYENGEGEILEVVRPHAKRNDTFLHYALGNPILSRFADDGKLKLIGRIRL